jgi:hypothetical protein
MQRRSLVMSCLLVAGCGSSKEAPPTAGSGSAAPAPAPAPTTPPAVAPTPPAETASESGTCVIKGGGAFTFEQTTAGSRSKISTWHWVSEAERDNVPAFVLNCTGKDASFSLTAGKQGLDAIPFGPKKYTFTNGRGGDGLTLLTMVRGEIFGSGTGTVDIAAFDAKHIAGTIDLTGKVNGQAVTLTGTFDYRCPGFSACAK